MYPFRNILVVIDSAESEQPVLNRAVDYALKHQSQLTIVDAENSCSPKTNPRPTCCDRSKSARD